MTTVKWVHELIPGQTRAQSTVLLTWATELMTQQQLDEAQAGGHKYVIKSQFINEEGVTMYWAGWRPRNPGTW